MRYSLTFTESAYADLRKHLFDGATTERAAFLGCGVATSSAETRLLVRSVVPVGEDDVIAASPIHMSIASRAPLRAIKAAAVAKESFVFVHSHPSHAPTHSPQDDSEERALFKTAYTRIHHEAVHASIVVSGADNIAGRVWLPDGTTAPISRVWVIGDRFVLREGTPDVEPLPTFADRQIRAFGPDIQRVLKRLTVGVVGLGGTGSAVVKQLARLGIGKLIVSDGQTFEASNVNRVYGSRLSDEGALKADLVKRTIKDLGLGTMLNAIAQPISYRSVLEQFRECDVIFGCTDDEFSRSLLTRFAIYYLIPVFDMAVQVDSADGTIREVEGRVTTLLPGTACLYCRARITPAGVRAQSLHETDPESAAALRAEGYIPELGEPAPSVIMFTTAVAASAVSELLHRLTGYLGNERKSSEVIHRFSATRLSTNTRSAKPDCFCSQPKYVGRGDRPLFLDTTWRAEL
jgi:molybdopterin/thiamine biosynthesis adenylyltransferase